MKIFAVLGAVALSISPVVAQSSSSLSGLASSSATPSTTPSATPLYVSAVPASSTPASSSLASSSLASSSTPTPSPSVIFRRIHARQVKPIGA